jgi:hypothetical protein
VSAPADERDRADVLGRVARFAHTVRLPVLGIPTTFATNDVRVVRLVEQAFGGWRALDEALIATAGHSVTVRLTVQPGEELGEHAELRFRVGDDGFVLVTTTASAGYADPLRREARAWVTDALVDDGQHFRYGVLEALTIALLSRLDRQPVHAAAIAHDGVALLLAGPSGAGKSTLTYAAADAGLQVLAEDVVYVQLRPELRLWGASAYLHLPPEAARHFNALDGAESVRLANGKHKLVVDLRGMAGGTVATVAGSAGICILCRGTRATPSLRALSPAEVVERLGTSLEDGFDLFPATVGAVHGALAAHGGWELTIGGPPSGHIAPLRRMLDALRERG